MIVPKTLFSKTHPQIKTFFKKCANFSLVFSAIHQFTRPCVTAGLAISAALAVSACQPNPDQSAEDNQAAIDRNQEVHQRSDDSKALDSQDSADPIDSQAADIAEENIAENEKTAIDAADSVESGDSDNAPVNAENRFKDVNKVVDNMSDEMMIAQRYLDPDVAFAKIMLGYQRSIRDLAKTQNKYGQNETMTAFADNLLALQQEEIGQLKKWLASHPDTAKPKAETPAMQAAFANEIQSMVAKMQAELNIADADLAFAQTLLPHYLGAIAMAKIELTYGRDDDMRQFAQSFINSRQPLVTLLESWVQDQHSLSEPNTQKSGSDETNRATKDENGAQPTLKSDK
ncbi:MULTISPECIES: DUF305 domain-containing protein [Psychrobacter]|uniref:DUF305 domain-containing protein n=1 Tax=Psychrobacter TaxID=497 RepID=UPI00146EA779|nr:MULTISPECIES: DUF305 domain-containing protein [Psychrobacter]